MGASAPGALDEVVFLGARELRRALRDADTLRIFCATTSRDVDLSETISVAMARSAGCESEDEPVTVMVGRGEVDEAIGMM